MGSAVGGLQTWTFRSLGSARYKHLGHWLMFVNLGTLAINGADKLLKISGRDCRVPEVILHVCTLLGGAPATSASMILFHHKSNKSAYQTTYMKACVAHISVLLFALIRH